MQWGAKEENFERARIQFPNRAEAAYPPTRNRPPHRIPDSIALPPETRTAYESRLKRSLK